MSAYAKLALVTGLAVTGVAGACAGPAAPPSAPAAAPPPAAAPASAAATPPAQSSSLAGAVAASPEEAVERFIEAQRKGDNTELRVLIHPPTSPYRFPGPAVISAFEIQERRVLTDEDARGIREPPPRLAGDVELKTWEEYAGGRTGRNAYYLRQFPEGWKIVALKMEM